MKPGALFSPATYHLPVKTNLISNKMIIIIVDFVIIQMERHNMSLNVTVTAYPGEFSALFTTQSECCHQQCARVEFPSQQFIVCECVCGSYAG